jgi:predicted small secreted protein
MEEKYTLWRILYPYLVNIKKLENEESIKILKRWLEKSNNLKSFWISIQIEKLFAVEPKVIDIK